MTAAEKLYTRQEIADILGITIKTLAGKIKTKEIKAVNLNAKQGGRPVWRIPAGNLKTYLARCAKE